LTVAQKLGGPGPDFRTWETMNPNQQHQFVRKNGIQSTKLEAVNEEIIICLHPTFWSKRVFPRIKTV
jgi:hypothetical protein